MLQEKKTVRPPLRPVDGFLPDSKGSAEKLVLSSCTLLSRPGERLIDYFLEDANGDQAEDPVPYCGEVVMKDGVPAVVVREINWEQDRFLSEIMESFSPIKGNEGPHED